MSNALKIAIVIALVAAVGLALTLKKSKQPPDAPQTPATAPIQSPDATPPPPADATPAPAPAAPAALPRLVDLGSTTCIPCKMMTPILEELKKEHAGRLEVEFIDVTVDRGAASFYAIRVIPTQIFLDASGKELFRHEGFFAKEDILSKWKELGVKLDAAPTGGGN